MDFSNKIGWLTLICAIGALYFIFNQIEDSNVMLTISFNFLLVIVIFVPLVVQRNIKEKIRRFIEANWKKNKEEFNRIVADIRNEFKRTDVTKIDYDKIIENAEKLTDISQEMAAHDIDLNKSTQRSILAFVLAIVLTVAHITSKQHVFLVVNDIPPITFSLFATIALVVGFYYFMQILIIWFEISKTD